MVKTVKPLSEYDLLPTAVRIFYNGGFEQCAIAWQSRKTKPKQNKTNIDVLKMQ